VPRRPGRFCINTQADAEASTHACMYGEEEERRSKASE